MSTLITRLHDNGSYEQANCLRKERSFLRSECDEALFIIRTTLDGKYECDTASIIPVTTLPSTEKGTADRYKKEQRRKNESFNESATVGAHTHEGKAPDQELIQDSNISRLPEENEEKRQTDSGSATGGAPANQEEAPVQDTSHDINNSIAPKEEGTSKLDSSLGVLDSQIDILCKINSKMSSQDVALFEIKTKSNETINKDHEIILDLSQQQGNIVGSHFESTDVHPEIVDGVHRTEPIDFCGDKLNYNDSLKIKITNSIVGSEFKCMDRNESSAPAVAISNTYAHKAFQTSFQTITTESYGSSTDVHNNNNNVISRASNFAQTGGSCPKSGYINNSIAAYGCSLLTNSRHTAKQNGGITIPNAYGCVSHTYENDVERAYDVSATSSKHVALLHRDIADSRPIISSGIKTTTNDYTLTTLTGSRTKEIQIKGLKVKGVGEKQGFELESFITNTERTERHEEIWDLPTFPILQNEKARLVLDSSAESRGMSLNGTLLPGADLNDRLRAVPLRFQVEAIGIADIASVFYRFYLKPKFKDKPRFLWSKDSSIHEHKNGSLRLLLGEVWVYHPTK